MITACKAATRLVRQIVPVSLETHDQLVRHLAVELVPVFEEHETTLAMLDNLIADLKAGRPIKPTAVEGLTIRRDALRKILNIE